MKDYFDYEDEFDKEFDKCFEYEKKGANEKKVIKLFQGSTRDIEVSEEDFEIRADVILNCIDTLNIWGEIKFDNCKPVVGAVVKLLKVIDDCYGEEYIEICKTVSDKCGRYKFEIDKNDKNDKFKIVASKKIEECCY
ncbi:hypothetical protein [Clostridium sp. Ade.TY]|uniref:hypothetical protein n=1 Tax=Clostridium sp. Ade.TY TaxID=1391647 RepID=UPI000406F449|nr:hypothetical protein [Clostridium sp. Ade.TY]